MEVLDVRVAMEGVMLDACCLSKTQPRAKRKSEKCGTISVESKNEQQQKKTHASHFGLFFRFSCGLFDSRSFTAVRPTFDFRRDRAVDGVTRCTTSPPAPRHHAGMATSVG